jgi:hypothetical protein
VYTVTARWARMPRLGREGFNGPSLFGGMSKRKPAPSVPMLAGVGGKVVNTGGGNTHDPTMHVTSFFPPRNTALQLHHHHPPRTKSHIQFIRIRTHIGLFVN